jgi:hypothetical protein
MGDWERSGRREEGGGDWTSGGERGGRVEGEEGLRRSTRANKGQLASTPWWEAITTKRRLGEGKDGKMDFAAMITETAMAGNRIKDPRSFEEAMRGSDAGKWKEAMKREMESFEEKKVFRVEKLGNLPKAVNIVDGKWVFKVKYNPDGSVERYKARYVARGFTQQYGIDYEDTFAPVSKLQTVRTMIAVAASKKMKMMQKDVTTAFLNGILKELIVMKPPEGFICESDEVWVLEKTIYGLKQSAHEWNEEVDGGMKKLGFTQTTEDPTLYIRYMEGRLLIVTIYVDDVIFAGERMDDLKWFDVEFGKLYKTTAAKRLNWVLGIEVLEGEEGDITLTQRRYILDMLEDFGMSECQGVSTPMDQKTRLGNHQSPQTREEKEYMKDKPYRRLVGKLMYAANATRPDISYSVSVLSRFNGDPGITHWKAGLRVLQYLKETWNMGLRYKLGNDEEKPKMVGYTDSDWAGEVDESRSQGGYVFLVNGGVVSWRSKRQSSVALSSTEAEYVALVECGREARWMKEMLKNFGRGYEMEGPILILIDNQSAMVLGEKKMVTEQTKHIRMRCNWIREAIERKELMLEYCRTEMMMADVLTKGLGRAKHWQMLGFLNFERTQSNVSLRGGVGDGNSTLEGG